MDDTDRAALAEELASRGNEPANVAVGTAQLNSGGPVVVITLVPEPGVPGPALTYAMVSMSSVADLLEDILQAGANAFGGDVQIVRRQVPSE